jgi:hypothetical protein
MEAPSAHITPFSHASRFTPQGPRALAAFFSILLEVCYTRARMLTRMEGPAG